jgi:hypothetical protein
MARLIWDKVDERLYETGIDRGVLYIPSSPGYYDSAVPWNGLISVDEEFEDSDPEAHYFDGIKYLDTYPIYDFKVNLEAYTYPDEFHAFEGLAPFGVGIYADDQPSKIFGLSYRTLIGNSEGPTQHYKIHLLYHLTAVPQPMTNSTQKGSVEPLVFNWSISSVPERAPGYRPTAHAIIDSRYLHPDLLQILEDYLYGSNDSEEIGLPSIEDAINFLLSWNPRDILPESTTGFSQLVPAEGHGDLADSYIPGLLYPLPSTRLMKTDKAGIYRLYISQPNR